MGAKVPFDKFLGEVEWGVWLALLVAAAEAAALAVGGVGLEAAEAEGVAAAHHYW